MKANTFNPKQNTLKTQTKKIPHAPDKNITEKNTQIKRYLTKNFSYSTFNNIPKKNPEKKITKVLSFTKKSKSINKINNINKTSTETFNPNNRKRKLSFTKRNKSSNNSPKREKKEISSMNNTKSNTKNVKVFIRFRPVNEVESSLLQNNYGWLVPKYISNTQLGIYNDKSSKDLNNTIFSFDKIFTPKSTQDDIYSNVGSLIVEDIMAGYNGTIFAYGQSGSGKTYTMYGEDIFDEDKKGIIPRIVCEIFKKMEKIEDVDFTIKLSVVEIYKEILYDLLTGKNNLKIIETKDKIHIENLSQIYLSDLNEFFDYTELSQRNRKVAETKLNHNSSRSHCIMILEVIQNFKKEKIIKKGILNLVDLAGSEKVSKTCAVGETLLEAKKINLSLSTLGNVIHSLTTKDFKGHIPYRDSKLTRILKESLGGNYKTYLIVTCSPHSFNLDEIISSLNFAKRVKCIKNKYKINIKYSYEELQDLVDKLNEKLNSAHNQINKLLKGEKIEMNLLINNNKDEHNKDFYFYEKEKKNLENKIQDLINSNQEKDNEIIKLKKQIENLKKKNKENNETKEVDKNKKNDYVIKHQEIIYTIKAEKEKKNELYEKIKETIKRIEEEIEHIKIKEREEEDINKMNMKKSQFNEIIKDFMENKDKIECFEKIDNIIKISIPYKKETDYKNIFNEFKNNINDIFIEQYTKNRNNDMNYSNIFNTLTINLFLEYIQFYFSYQIMNQGYIKLLLDNNSLYKMNKYLISIINDILIDNYDISNENALNQNAINLIRASLADSFISRQGGNINTTFSELNKKMVKVVKGNQNSLRLRKTNSILDDLRNSNFSKDINNSKLYFNKRKSIECDKNNGKINMIKNVLVNIIKETDNIKYDIKDINENINITIKSIMNYFCQKILKNKNVELDINNNLIIEKNNANMNTLKSIDSSNYIKNDENKNPNIDNNKLKKNKKIKSKKKFENSVPIPKQINQAKGDDFDNDNNCFTFV